MGMVSSVQTKKNLVANIIYFVINIAIGIFLVPFFISTLGIASYGLIPLATSLIGYVGILTDSLNSAVSRHLTIDMQNVNKTIVNRTYNSAFFGLSKVIALLIPFVILSSYLAPLLFGVPSENSGDASWLFIGIGLAFLIRAWSSNFTVTLYGSNRIDLINIIYLLNIVVQITLIFILFFVCGPSLAYVGLSYLVGAIVATIAAYLLHRVSNQAISINHEYYKKEKFQEMARMGGWIIINQIGSLLLLNIDLIIVNYLYGNAVGGEYAIAFQWVGLLRGLAMTFISIIGPIILISYAHGQRGNIVSISRNAVKLTGIGIALPIGLICGFAPSVLSTWVGEQFVDLAPLMVLLTFHLIINTAVIPLFQINIAFNKVRLPAIVTLITGVSNFVLAFILALIFDWGIYGIAAAGMISLTLKNVVFTPIYASIVMSVPKVTFYPSVIPGVAATFGIAALAIIISYFMETQSIVILILMGGAIALVYIFIAWKFLLNGSDKMLLLSKSRSS
jgi:membrane protein EpsK